MLQAWALAMGKDDGMVGDAVSSEFSEDDELVVLQGSYGSKRLVLDSGGKETSAMILDKIYSASISPESDAGEGLGLTVGSYCGWPAKHCPILLAGFISIRCRSSGLVSLLCGLSEVHNKKRPQGNARGFLFRRLRLWLQCGPSASSLVCSATAALWKEER